MAKRSRRERRLEPEKASRPVADSAKAALDQIPARPEPAQAPAAAETATVEAVTGRKAGTNFRQEYFYVYQELITISIVAVVMFVVLVGLSFVI